MCKKRGDEPVSPYYANEQELNQFQFNSQYITEDDHIVSHNPNFYQCVTMDIEIITDSLVPPPTIIILLKHQRYRNKKKSETVLLGRYWMSLETEKNVKLKDKWENRELNFVFQRPSWIPMIYDKKEKIDGRILMSYTLIELDDNIKKMRLKKRDHTYKNAELLANAIDHGYIRDFSEEDKYPLMADYHMWPESNLQELNIFMLGFRDVGLKKKMPEMSCILRIHGVIKKYEKGFKKMEEEEEVNVKSKPKTMNALSSTANKMIKNGEQLMKKMGKGIREQNKEKNEVDVLEEGQEIGFSLDEDLSTITVNTLLKVRVEVPNVVELAPILEVFLFSGRGKNKKLISTGNLNMKRAFAYYYGIEDNIDYKERIMDFMKIRSTGQGEAGELKPDVKVKIPRVQAQNKMNYFGVNYVVEMPDIKKAMEKEEQEANDKVRTENITNKDNMTLHIKEDFGEDEKDRGQPMDTIMEVRGKDFEEDEEDIRELKSGPMKFGKLKKINLKKSFKVDDFMKKMAKEKILKGEEPNGEENEQLLQKNKNVKSQFIKFKNRAKNQLNQSIDQFADDKDDKFNDIKVDFNQSGSQEKNYDTKDEFEDQLEDLRVERNNFSLTSEQIKEFNDDIVREEIENLQIGHNKIKKMDPEISPKAVNYKDEFVEENEDAKIKRKRELRNKFLNKFKIGGGMKSLFRKIKKKMDIEYVEFDTDDDEEDLEQVLPFLKGRYFYGDDLEDLLFPKHKIRNIEHLKMFTGSQRADANSLFQKWMGIKAEEHRQQGLLKVTFYREDEIINTDKIKSFMTKLMRPRKYVVRAYILRGIKMSGITVDDESLKTFIKVSMNKKKASITTGSEVKREGFFPEYYEAYEFRELEMPGTALIDIEVWESTLIGSVLLGTCQVDLEDRIFDTRWRKWEQSPVENRSIVNPIHGVRGRLEMWIDIIPEGDKTPMTPIFPIERLPFELRAVVWITKDCVIKDTIAECNDVFVRGGVMRGNQFLETDTHWRCRSDGSFNYRWKYDITLPVEEERNYGEDKFKLQIWDRDLIMANDLIGEFEVDLNKHKMLKKAYKRKEPVEMRMKISGSGIDTNQIFFDVYHPEVIDDYTGSKISQGKVLMSFEVLPKENADNLKNGVGRLDPNFFPTLPQPVGRFSFDIFSPCETIKQIIGPKMCYRIIYLVICIFLCVIAVFVGYFAFTSFIGVSMANIFIR